MRSLHILGICGTFMGGVAALAQEMGVTVEGSDANVHPPMSSQLKALGIGVRAGYAGRHLQPAPDLVVVGNVMRRGHPAVEYMLNAQLPYVSGPQWLSEAVLAGRQVLAVAGTHGKTTTASLLAFLLECQGRHREDSTPGFLIGGVPGNFGVSARLGTGRPFVIEADEYDTAFFDKRSKFLHYQPRIVILNNLEYDHADIFADVAAIQRQFHHLVRIVPGHGRLIVNAHDTHLAQVLSMGCWTPAESFGIGRGHWRAHLLEADGCAFGVSRGDEYLGEVRWSLPGRHNVMNALAALAAATAAGADAKALLPFFAGFKGVKRRLEQLGEVDGVRVYDDFAHHPTAIATTLAGLRARLGQARILVALELRSRSMCDGVHAHTLGPALAGADVVLCLPHAKPAWDTRELIEALGGRGTMVRSVDTLLEELRTHVHRGDCVIFMSNGDFEDAPRRFVGLLRAGQVHRPGVT